MTIQETDLPCSACGGTLEQRSVPTDDLPLEADLDGPVISVAECIDCGERHYPTTALEALHRQRGEVEAAPGNGAPTGGVSGGGE